MAGAIVVGAFIIGFGLIAIAASIEKLAQEIANGRSVNRHVVIHKEPD